MNSLLVLLVVTLLCFTWLRAAQRNRRRWISQLDLPGRWLWEDHEGVLELSGDLDAGRYRITEPGVDEAGRWSLVGHELRLDPEDGGAASRLDLRMFGEGKIGLDGPRRQRRIYVKQRNNVVPLRPSA